MPSSFLTQPASIPVRVDNPVQVICGATTSNLSNSQTFAVFLPLAIQSATLPNATAGSPYGPVALAATGGVPPYTWIVTSLPSGLTATGANIGGTPATQGSFTFTARVTDTLGNTTTRLLNVTINPALVITSSSPLPVGTVGVAYGPQTLTATGGAPPYTWTIPSRPPGLSASGATISGTPSTAGSYTIAAQVTDSLSVKSGKNLVLTVNPATFAPVLSVAPSSLVFQHVSGAAAPPRQSLSVFSSPPDVNFAVTASSDERWLTATPLSGVASQIVQAAVNPAGLPPGTYTGVLTVTATSTSLPDRTVNVKLMVEAPSPPKLEVTPLDISVASAQRGLPVTHSVAVSNSGGGTLRFTMQKTAGGGWLSVPSAPMTAPANVALSIDPSNLAPGVYGAQVQVTADNAQSATVNLRLAVSRLNHAILVSQSAVDFTAIAGGVVPPVQTLAVSNAGQGAMDWSVEVETIPLGRNWLRITPARGTHTSGNAPDVLRFAIDPQGLAAGTYYATARIVAPTAANSPQSVSVVLNLGSANLNAPPILSSAGVLQIAQSGGSNPAADTIELFNLTGRALNFTSTRSTADGSPWLAVSPERGTIPASGSATVAVQGNIAALAPGLRQGTVRLGFEDGSVSTVSVFSSVAPRATTEAPKGGNAAIPGCTNPSRLIPVILDPEDGFTAVAQEGKRIRVQVKDDCDNAMTSGAVRLSITGGSFLLIHEGQGIWASTLTPPSAADTVRMVAEAFQSLGGGRQIGGTSPILTGSIVPPASAARAFAEQVRNNATNQPAPQVALGSWVSIHGERLADAVKIADTAPYPSTLSGTEVRLGNLNLPLYYVSDKQVNALIPASLIPNTQHQLLVRRGDTQSSPVPITVAEVQPGIYAMNSQGFGQGAVLIGNTSMLAAPPGSVAGWISRPVNRGETVLIFAAGLGPVRNPPPDGAPGAGQTVLDPPEVLIAEQSAQVAFAGLAPGLVGLYQVNAVIPAGVAPGPAVPVQFRQRDVLSNVVTIAVD